MKELRNKLNKEEAMKLVENETFNRTTISFYRYTKVEDPQSLRDDLFKKWSKLGVLGRIYLSQEGINAQLCIPEHNVDAFRTCVDSYEEFKDVPFKIALADEEISFWKLTIKVKEYILADGLAHDEYDVTNVGEHLDAESFNKSMESEDTIVVDMRNQYESEIGYFEGAITPKCNTFKEELPMVADELKGKEDKKVLLYCTGGIRCEKTSAYLKDKGFKDVNQLHGGIIDYVRQIKQKGLTSKFIGKNFVFDGRRAEKVTDDVLGTCFQCKKPADTHVDCANLACHVMFIQCADCEEKMQMTCSDECQKIIQLPEEEQRALRKGKKAKFLIHCAE
jgi:UPF0176 protein